MEEANVQRTKFAYFKMIGVVCVCLVFVVGIIVGLVAIRERDRIKNRLHNKMLCLSDDCSRQASRIRRNMDAFVNPCTDFYNFTCGNFMRRSEFPPDETRLLVALENMYIIERELLASYSVDSKNLVKPIRDIQTFYHQCVKSEQEQLNSTINVTSFLHHVKWPLVEEDWNEEYSRTFKWLDVEAALSKAGLSPAILRTEVKIDIRNYSAAYIGLDCTAPILPQEMLDNIESLSAYKNIINEFIEMTGQPSGEYGSEILKFLMRLQRIKPIKFQISDTYFLHSFLTIKAGIISKRLKLDIVKFLNDILPDSVRVTSDTIVSTNSYNCLRGSASILRAADKRIVSNYMVWAGVQNVLWILNEKTRKLNFRINQLRTGVKAPLQFYQKCYHFIDEQLPELSSAMYVKTNVAAKEKKHLNALVTLIIKELMYVVNEAVWMDTSTKRMAREKVKTLRAVINYDEEFVQDDYLNSAYGNLTLTSSIVQNVMHIRRTSFLHTMGTLNWPAQKRNRATLLPQAHVINAYYHPGLNSIGIPAGITQGYLFSEDQEAYSNFGAMGIIIGHELSHMFDVTGRLYDAQGNYINWWSDQSNSKYMEKSHCFIKQYDNFTYGEDLRVNGTLTVGENMADASGMLLAYRAFLKWKRKHKVKRLPGLEKYTLRQMFWISVGNTWCDKLRPEMLADYFQTNVHSLGRFRILGTLSNIPQFSRDFGCPLGSFMNRKNKCIIW